MSQEDIDKLTDDEWAMFWNDLLWCRKQEKDESLKQLKKLGII
jgi:hypothetical protein